jgi:hypothetical protein
LVFFEIFILGSASWYEIDAVKLFGDLEKISVDMDSKKQFNLTQFINDPVTSDAEVELDSKKVYKVHKLLMSRLNLDFEKNSKIHIPKISERAFETVLDLIYSNFSLDEVFNEKFRQKKFQFNSLEDLVQISTASFSNIFIELPIATQLETYLTSDFVLDLLSTIENSIRENQKVRFDDKNLIKKMCLDYFRNLPDRQFNNKVILNKFENLIDDLKIELITLIEVEEEFKTTIVPKYKSRESNESLNFAISNLFSKSMFTDGLLVSKDNKEFPIHKILLIADSSFFFTEYSKSDKLKVDFDSKSVEVYLEWIYCRKESLLQQKIIEDMALQFQDSRLMSCIKGESLEMFYFLFSDRIEMFPISN